MNIGMATIYKWQSMVPAGFLKNPKINERVNRQYIKSESVNNCFWRIKIKWSPNKRRHPRVGTSPARLSSAKNNPRVCFE